MRTNIVIADSLMADVLTADVVDIEAGDEVRNLDQIAVGDKVKVTYYESVAVYLGIPGSQPEVDAAEVAGRTAKGEKPGSMVVGGVDVSATVKGIDKQNDRIGRRLKLAVR